jgi:hypothetical protein
MSSSRRLNLLYTSQERRSAVASWSSQTDDLVVGNPEEMCMIRQAGIATMQYVEPTNRPRLHRHPQIPQRQKLSHSPLRPTRPRLAPSSLSCLWSPARTSLRSEGRPNFLKRDEIWREGQSDPPYSLAVELSNEKAKRRLGGLARVCTDCRITSSIYFTMRPPLARGLGHSSQIVCGDITTCISCIFAHRNSGH